MFLAKITKSKMAAENEMAVNITSLIVISFEPLDLFGQFSHQYDLQSVFRN